MIGQEIWNQDKLIVFFCSHIPLKVELSSTCPDIQIQFVGSWLFKLILSQDYHDSVTFVFGCNAIKTEIYIQISLHPSSMFGSIFEDKSVLNWSYSFNVSSHPNSKNVSCQCASSLELCQDYQEWALDDNPMKLDPVNMDY